MRPKAAFSEQTKLFMRLKTAEMNIFISFFIIFSIFERTVMFRYVTSHMTTHGGQACRHVSTYVDMYVSTL